ncbi:MAG: hypothetical protein GY760_15490 [Deltaproteobacteria bacterium]|nr:hypothetical protein [Deltaproteobacteria bacterium]
MKILTINIIISIILFLITNSFAKSNNINKLPLNDYDIIVYKLLKSKTGSFYKKRTIEINEISLERKKSDSILKNLLFALSTLKNVKVEKKIFFSYPVIKIGLGVFTKTIKDSDMKQLLCWRDIFYNPFLNQFLIFIDDKLYKSGNNNALLTELIKEVFNYEKIITTKGANKIFFVKNNFEEKASVIMLNGSKLELLKTIPSAYNASTCKSIQLFKNKLHLEVVESVGRGTSVNYQILSIYKIDYKNVALERAFQYQISGYYGPSEKNFFQHKYKYVDLDFDSIKEIVINIKGKEKIYKFSRENNLFIED